MRQAHPACLASLFRLLVSLGGENAERFGHWVQRPRMFLISDDLETGLGGGADDDDDEDDDGSGRRKGKTDEDL